MLIMGVFIKEVSSDADDDDGADPGQGIAGRNGEAESLGGNDEGHFNMWCCDVIGLMSWLC
jgi:hypothetical protein